MSNWSLQRTAAFFYSVVRSHRDPPHATTIFWKFISEAHMADSWFQKEEYLTLRKEVESNVAELANLEKLCVGGVAGIFAWVSKNSGDLNGFENFAWMVPSLLPVFGMLKANAIGVHLGILGDYLLKIERAQLTEGMNPEGWESYFQNNGTSERAKQAKLRWKALAWVTLSGSTVGLVQSLFR